MDKYQESLRKIAGSIRNKNRVEYIPSLDEDNLQRAVKNIINLQYSPGQEALCEYLEAGASLDAYNKILNSYTFIPIKTITSGIENIGNGCSVSFDTNWFNYGCKIREYIKIDVNNIGGEKIQDVFGYLSDFFPSGVRLSNILADDMSPVLHIDADTSYFLTIKLNPKTFNPYGKISNEIEELRNLSENSEVDKNEIEKAIADVVSNTYIPWAIKAQTELYNWFMNLQSDFIQVPLKENESLCDGQKSYEIKLNIMPSENSVDWTELVKRTLPLSSVFQYRNMDLSTLSVGFSQGATSLVNYSIPVKKED